MCGAGSEGESKSEAVGGPIAPQRSSPRSNSSRPATAGCAGWMERCGCWDRWVVSR